MTVAYKLPGFGGRFVSQTGRVMRLADVWTDDVVEVRGNRRRVCFIRHLPLARIALLDANRESFYEGREVDRLRVWRAR